MILIKKELLQDIIENIGKTDCKQRNREYNNIFQGILYDTIESNSEIKINTHCDSGITTYCKFGKIELNEELYFVLLIKLMDIGIL